MLGDFIRGRQALAAFSEEVQRGVLLHRHIDVHTDALPEVASMRRWFDAPFRRFSGIVIDLAIDHELAKRWTNYSEVSLDDFDLGVRLLLARHDELLPDRLRRFMLYADRRGLFAAYRSSEEILYSLEGIGRRLSRPNPLHRVHEIWDDFEPQISARFEPVFGKLQSEVAEWLKLKSTITGS